MFDGGRGCDSCRHWPEDSNRRRLEVLAISGRIGEPCAAGQGPATAPETKGELKRKANDRLDAGKLKGEIMGSVFKKTATKPLPAGAKIIVRKGQRLAEWLDAKEKRRTAPVTVGKDGTDRIVITAKTYTAKYRDGSGMVQEVATGCRDESAARSLLTDLERRAEKVKGGDSDG